MVNKTSWLESDASISETHKEAEIRIVANIHLPRQCPPSMVTDFSQMESNMYFRTILLKLGSTEPSPKMARTKFEVGTQG